MSVILHCVRFFVWEGDFLLDKKEEYQGVQCAYSVECKIHCDRSTVDLSLICLTLYLQNSESLCCWDLGRKWIFLVVVGLEWGFTTDRLRNANKNIFSKNFLIQGNLHLFSLHCFVHFESLGKCNRIIYIFRLNVNMTVSWVMSERKQNFGYLEKNNHTKIFGSKYR